MSKIRVLHIIKSLGRGGAEMLLQETLKAHDHSRFEFLYIYFLPWKDQMVKGLKDAGGIVTVFPAKNNILIALQAPAIIRYIREKDIKLVHCHLPWAGFVGRYIHTRIGIPVIYSEHNKQERYHKITKTINKLTFNRQTHVIAVSADVAQSIEENIHPRIPVQTILNGVNMEHFIRDVPAGFATRKQYEIDPSCIVIGTIAVFRFQKRLKEWIDVFKAIYEKFPTVRGCIVGDGILNSEIRDYVKSQGMDKAIVLPGLQTNVLPWLSVMDIFMMSSEFEGLPVALLEAMSVECAVVCTDAGGIKEVIRNESDGFLVPLNEWRDLIKPLEYLIKNPTEIRNYGSRARKRVEESFSLEAMVKQIEDMYFKVASEA